MFLKSQLKHLFVIGTVRIMRNKGQIRNCHVQEKLKETGLKNVWTPGENLRTGKKKTLGKTEEIQIKYNLTLMIIMHWYWLISCDKCPILMWSANSKETESLWLCWQLNEYLKITTWKDFKCMKKWHMSEYRTRQIAQVSSLHTVYTDLSIILYPQNVSACSVPTEN